MFSEIPVRHSLTQWVSSQTAVALMSRMHPPGVSLTACIIGRDNERTLAACLAGVVPWTDQIVFVDTGSTDRTPDIAREFGAEVHVFPWIDDFSAARNESLRHARGEWIFWLDTDDTLDTANDKRLRELVDGLHAPVVLGYVLQVHCPRPNRDGLIEVTVVDHVKLFRNRPDLRFEGRIHEQILPPIRRANGRVEFTNIFVEHSGADQTPEGRRRKLERDLRISATSTSPWQAPKQFHRVPEVRGYSDGPGHRGLGRDAGA